jgi:hypothetical protein
MKWVNLLWSIVLLGFIILFFARLSSRSTGVISAGFGFAAIAWVAIVVVSPIILLLRIFRVIKYATSFIYILTGTANFAIGLPGLYYVIRSATQNGYQPAMLLIINVLIGSFIYIDSFIITIPGYRRDK